MNRCFDMGTPVQSSSDKTRSRRNRTIFQSFSNDVQTDLANINERNTEIKVSESNQIVFQNQSIQLDYTKGLYEDAIACGEDDNGCIFIDREGDGYGRENRLFDIYQAPYTIQDTSGVTIDISGVLSWNLKYIQPLGMYYDIGCDRVSNYLDYTTISGEPVDRDNFNFKYPLSLRVE